MVIILILLFFSVTQQKISLTVERLVDLENSYLFEQLKIKIINNDQQDLQTFQHYVNKKFSNDIFHIKAVDSFDNELNIQKQNDNSEYEIYSIQLQNPLQQNNEQVIMITNKYLRRMVPYPQNILQSENQNLILEDNIFFNSMYHIQEQVTQYQAKLILSYDQLEKSQKQDDFIQYGPFFDMTGNEIQLIKIHFQNNEPQAVFKKVSKKIEVSHWGNIAIEIDYHIKNEGAKLIGEFSRIDYRRQNVYKSAITKFHQELPITAWGHSYRDSIGNITTSQVRIQNKEQKISVDLKPRFEIYGGWQTSFKIGYNLPLFQYLLKGKDSNLYQLTQKFGYDIQGIVAEEYEIIIILPEFSQNIKFNLQQEIYNFYQTSSYSTLDTQGRPTLVFQKKNHLDDIETNLVIEYNYQNQYHFLKPFLLLSIFLIIFTVLIILNRLNFKSLK